MAGHAPEAIGRDDDELVAVVFTHVRHRHRGRCEHELARDVDAVRELAVPPLVLDALLQQRPRVRSLELPVPEGARDGEHFARMCSVVPGAAAAEARS